MRAKAAARIRPDSPWPRSKAGWIAVGLAVLSVLAYATLFFELLPGMGDPDPSVLVTDWEAGGALTGIVAGLGALIMGGLACFVRHDTALATIVSMLYGGPWSWLAIGLIFELRS